MGISYRFANNLIVLVHSQALINNLFSKINQSKPSQKHDPARRRSRREKCGGAMAVCEPLSEAANGVPKMVNSVV